MFFSSWSDFFNMGGYGFYVWLSYAICFIAIFILFIQSIKEKHKVLAEVHRQQQRELRLQQAQQSTENQL